ncbi:urease accessory protein UreD [Primorskyibacter aestuariivivens]|uniref:urease accessory protein UreD n=1 Tax=Primorskyibacter aestuariivivens TaxID=1888912 RepID=UPI002300A561|nr:urease accessory protein UreD [Primorskyibacter aestuariivivens]MDA7427993.1 urease accessory protein UreD [Primorskyibacter aestuariivivens]
MISRPESQHRWAGESGHLLSAHAQSAAEHSFLRRPAITLLSPDTPIAATPVQPRTRGTVTLSAKRLGPRSVIDGLRQSGSYKALFPRTGDMLQSILINTSGGVTGGDRLALEAGVGVGAALSLTTQAAERAYRSLDGSPGQVCSRITVGDEALLHWLPQELILYEGCALRRTLEIDLTLSSRLLMVEPVIFGRVAMGEVVTSGAFHDDITVRRAGRQLYRDATRLSGDITARLARPAVASGAKAMASLLFVDPRAEALLPRIRDMMPETGGASLLAADVLTLRLLAEDSHALRQHLLPVLDLLSDDTLPVSWRL